MKDAEDEAFDDLARRQGMWGGGFNAKRAAAADKQEPWNEDEWRRNNWRCGHGWLRGEQCEICNAPQPVQEPVALVIDGVLVKSALPEKYTGHLYTTPPQRPWVDLSDSQIEQVYYDVVKIHRGAAMPWGQVQFGRALQALIKEKNT